MAKASTCYEKDMVHIEMLVMTNRLAAEAVKLIFNYLTKHCGGQMMLAPLPLGRLDRQLAEYMR